MGDPGDEDDDEIIKQAKELLYEFPKLSFAQRVTIVQRRRQEGTSGDSTA